MSNMRFFAVLAILLLPSAASAHERWFIDPASVSTSRPEIFSTPTSTGIYLLSSAVIIFLIMLGTRTFYLTSNAVRRLENRLVFPFHARQVLAVLIGATLVSSSLSNFLLAPNNLPASDSYVAALKIFEFILGFIFIFGEYWYFEASILLLILLGLAAPITPLAVMGEDLIFPATAILLLATAPRFYKGLNFSLEIKQKAYSLFRLLIGLNFIYLASEKWLTPEISITLVNQHHLNFLQGLGANSEVFVFIAALVETVVGLAIILNLYLRPVAAFTFIIFTTSVYVLGYKELIGHLPIQAALAVLYLYGPLYHSHYQEHLRIGKTSIAFDKLPV